MDNFSALIPGIVSSGLALLGVVLGAKISNRGQSQEARKAMLVEAYSAMYDGYYRCLREEASDDSIVALCVALERVMLLCTPDVAEVAKRTLLVLMMEPVDFGLLGDLMCELRTHAHEDVCGKNRRQC